MSRIEGDRSLENRTEQKESSVDLSAIKKELFDLKKEVQDQTPESYTARLQNFNEVTHEGLSSISADLARVLQERVEGAARQSMAA